MTPLESRVRLEHIRLAAEKIHRLVENKTYDEYAADEALPGAIEREFITIGEALKRAIDTDPSIENGITGSRQIIGLRNRFIHNYPSVDSEVVWRLIHQHLPLLLAEVRALLAEP